MRFESEVISDEILPAIRKIMAVRLHSDYGLTQREVSQKLGVTQPAVSQYLKGKRADKQVVKLLKEDPQIDVLLEDAVSKAAKNQDFSQEIAQLIKNSRDKGLFKEKFKDTKRCL